MQAAAQSTRGPSAAPASPRGVAAAAASRTAQMLNPKYPAASTPTSTSAGTEIGPRTTSTYAMRARQNPTAASADSSREAARPFPFDPFAAPVAMSPATAVGEMPSLGSRSLALLSALAFVGSVLLFIWVIQPLRVPVLSGAFLLCIVLLAVAINVRANESPGEVGFRVDNLWAAARLVLPATLLLALPVILLAFVVHGHVRMHRLALGLALYPLWGLAQQYALQAVVFRRARAAGAGVWAAPLAAALFALVHAPNPGLVLATFVGGIVWCELYRRVPNLFLLAVSHGALATLLLALLPWRVNGGLRIGPDYVRAHRAHQARMVTPPPGGARPAPGRIPNRRPDTGAR